MTHADKKLDDYWKRIFHSLRPVPPHNASAMAKIKQRYLQQAENLRLELPNESTTMEANQAHRKPGLYWSIQRRPLAKLLFAIILAVVVILVGSSLTVYAAQSSLPGQPLYAIKSWSEDMRLTMTISTKAKLSLTLDYTNRRVDEISSLMAKGNPIDDMISNRFREELDSALQLAAMLDDSQIQTALGKIKSHAESQGITIEELISSLPPQAMPAITRLQERLDEQILLSNVGEDDPQAFREQIREKLEKRKGPKPSSDEEQNLQTPANLNGAPGNEKGNDNQGGGMPDSTDVPGHNGQGNGQGQLSPGNEDHGPDVISTPLP